MSKKIRGQYIKNLVADKDSLSEQLKANTKEALQSLLEDTVKDGLRGVLTENDEKDDENSFDVEEIENTETPTEETEETSEVTVDTDDNTDDATDTESGETETVETDTEATTDGDDMWNDLEKYRGENGEYDLTGMDNDSAIKVLQAMRPEDGVRVVKNNNGSITLTDDETEKEYIIDIEGTMTSEGGSEGDDLMNEENLGYTDNYQNKTAMTTPDNHEPGKHVRDWDKGAPKGTEKRWVGNKGDMSPFNQSVNEGENECNNECGANCLYEVEIDDAIDEQSRFGKANEKGMHKTPKSSEDSTVYGSHVISREGEYTGNEPSGKVNESKVLANMIRKANAIMNENKELRKIAEDLKKQINEAVVINSSLAKVINLVTENSTTKNEKVEILQRFNEVKSVEESKKLYETISHELQGKHPINNTNLINNQLNESKSQAVETQMYKTEETSDIINFMKRLDKIKK